MHNIWCEPVPAFRMELSDYREISEIFVSQMPADGHITIWRLTGLYVPASMRGQGIGRHLVETALRFIAKQTAGAAHRVYLEAAPYERDDSPATMDPETLRAFYCTCGFLPVPGHPFAMVNSVDAPPG